MPVVSSRRVERVGVGSGRFRSSNRCCRLTVLENKPCPDHEETAAAALQGGPEALTDAVVRTSPRLVRLAARILGDLAEAEDVVQDAYLRAQESLAEGRFDGRASLSTWLYRIVANLAVDTLRKRKRREQPADVGEPSDFGGEAALQARLALRELDSWLAELPHEQRAALVLSAMEGQSNAEIARILGTSEGAIEQRLVRARATLRKKGRSDHDRA